MRIIDIFMEGCKVYIADFDRWELVQAGMAMRAAKLLLGSKVEMPLPRIIPRMVKPLHGEQRVEYPAWRKGRQVSRLFHSGFEQTGSGIAESRQIKRQK